MSEGSASIDPRSEAIGILKSKYKEAVRQLRASEEHVKALETERDSAHTEASTAKSKYDESKLKGDNDRLKSELRSRDHRDAFRRIAKVKGATDDTADVLWQTSGYQAVKDEIDEEAIGQLIEGQKIKPGLSRLFGEPGENGAGPRPGPASGQGSHDSTGGKFRVTLAQLRDPMWCHANDARRAKAIEDGTLEIVD